MTSLRLFNVRSGPLRMLGACALFLAATPAFAMSPGCLEINQQWGFGRPVIHNGLYNEHIGGLSFGEKVSYSVVTSSGGVVPETPKFQIRQGPFLEVQAKLDELLGGKVSGSFVLGHTDLYVTASPSLDGEMIVTLNCTGADIEAKAPAITSLSVSANGTYRQNQQISFTANFDQPVYVTGTPWLEMVVGQSMVEANYVSGSGTSALTFNYAIRSGDEDADGITLGALSLNDGSIKNESGDAAKLDFQAGSTSGLLVDAVAPELEGIVLDGQPSPADESVTFKLDFSESVEGVSLNSFSLGKTDTADGDITLVTGSGSQYAVKVSHIKGRGSLVFGMAHDNGITDLAGNALRLLPSSGVNHIVDMSTVSDAPVIDYVAPSSEAVTVYFHAPEDNGGSDIVSYTVTAQPGGKTVTAAGSPIIVGGLENGTGYAFTVVATNDVGDSVASAQSETVYPRDKKPPMPMVISPMSGALPAGTIGVNYEQKLVASALDAEFKLHSDTPLPAGLELDWQGRIHGTPTMAGQYSFTVVASDKYAGEAMATYTLVVIQPDIHEPAPTDFAFSPSAGTLPQAMAGEAYEQSISATGGHGLLFYRVSEGQLPNGLILNQTTGTLTGPLATHVEGDYVFTIEVHDENDATATADYALKVVPRKVTVTDKAVDVPAGATPMPVSLTAGATGGPFTDAAVTFVEPANAGTARLVMGEVAQSQDVKPMGWYLKFTPNPAYSGKAKVGFRLTSAMGVSNTGTVTYNLGINAQAVADDIDGKVADFVGTRMSLLASSVEVPNLMTRRRMAAAMGPVSGSVSPAGDGVALSFATSIVQVNAAHAAIDGVEQAPSDPFNAWIEGKLLVHNRAENGNRWGTFALLSAGVDYLLSDQALVGVSLHYDRFSDPVDEDGALTGQGWLAGPYASIELGSGVFWDSSILYGQSSNDIGTEFWDGSFETSRWLLDTAISGEWRLDEVTTLTPKLRAVYLSETVQGYDVVNGAGDVLSIDGFTADQLRVSLGAELARQFLLDNGTMVTPNLGFTAGFAGLDGQGAFGSLSAGLTIQPQADFSITGGVLLNVQDGGDLSVGGKIGLSGRF